jgi:hypothetical protein
VLLACSAYFAILKMEAGYSSEMAVDFYQTTRRHIPGDSTIWSYLFQDIYENKQRNKNMQLGGKEERKRTRKKQTNRHMKIQTQKSKMTRRNKET